jgi:phosphate/sulfate permease
MQLVMAVVFTLLTWMLILEINKNLVPHGATIFETWMYGVLVGAFIIGFTVCRAWMIRVTMSHQTFRYKLRFLSKLFTFDEVIEYAESEEAKKHRVDFLGDRIDDDIVNPDRPESKIKGIFIVNEMYRFLMIVSAFTMNTAHGANDVSNAITSMNVTNYIWHKFKNGVPPEGTSRLPFGLASLGIALGLLTLGRPVLNTVGKKIIKLSFVVGFCAQMSAALSSIIASFYGIPVSTTYCMVGALVGIVVARKIPFCKYAFVADDQRQELDNYLEWQTFATGHLANPKIHESDMMKT